MQPINHKTNNNYTARQLKLPLEIEKIINISDPVYTFCDVMDHIDLTPYFVEVKGYKTGRPRCDAEKLLKVILFAFMENGYCSLRDIEKLCNNDIRFMYLLDEMKEYMSDYDILAHLISRIGEDVAMDMLIDIKAIEIGDNDDTLTEGQGWNFFKSNHKDIWNGKYDDTFNKMSPEEREDLDTRVRLSGLTKQEYMVRRLLERDVVVQPSSRIFKALRDQMTEILEELKRIESGASVDDELLATIKTVAETYNGLEEKKKS